MDKRRERIERFKSNAEVQRKFGDLQGCLEFKELAEELEKLEKIEQIIDDCDLEAWEVLEKIKEVLKQEVAMAEYIDRQDLIKFLDSIQQPKMPITEGFKYITIDEAIRVVSERPTADVIERSKIDKAIEEIEDLDPITERVGLQVKQEILNILKRNIGE